MAAPSSPWSILGSLRIDPTTSSSPGGSLGKIGLMGSMSRVCSG